jgi:hypothetical protein
MAFIGLAQQQKELSWDRLLDDFGEHLAQLHANRLLLQPRLVRARANALRRRALNHRT